MRVLWCAWVLLWMASPALAAEVRLDLAATEWAAGQKAAVRVDVLDGKPLAVPRIAVPDGLELEYLGPSNFTVRAGGRLMPVARYEYTLTALTAGDYVLGPATVELADGSDAKSQTRGLTVVEDAGVFDAAFDAEIAFMPDEAWEGQVVLFRYRLRTRKRPARTRWFPFEWEGLVAPRDGDRPRREYVVEDAVGRLWMDETLIPLIVTGTGELSLETAILQMWLPSDERRDPLGLLGRSKMETLTVGPAPLRSKPLPAAPDEFSGLVGDFTLEASFDTTTLAVGESAIWSVRLLGDGALDGFAPPRPEADDVRIYEGSTSTSGGVRDGRYRSAARFDLSVVPTKAGEVRVPDLELVVFSPSTGEYTTLRAAGTVLRVTPGSGTAVDLESFAPDADQAEPVIAEPPDIRGVKSFGLTRAVWLGPVLPWLLGLLGLPGLLALLAGGVDAIRARAAARRKPKQVQMDPLARLRVLPEGREQRLTEVDAALREALALREGVTVGTLDRAQAIDNLPAQLRDEVVAFSRALDRARFADGSEQGLVDQVIVLVDAVSEAERAA